MQGTRVWNCQIIETKEYSGLEAQRTDEDKIRYFYPEVKHYESRDRNAILNTTALKMANTTAHAHFAIP